MIPGRKNSEIEKSLLWASSKYLYILDKPVCSQINQIKKNCSNLRFRWDLSFKSQLSGMIATALVLILNNNIVSKKTYTGESLISGLKRLWGGRKIWSPFQAFDVAAEWKSWLLSHIFAIELDESLDYYDHPSIRISFFLVAHIIRLFWSILKF